MHTGFIQQHYDTLFPTKIISDDVLAQAAIGLIVNENNAALRNSLRAGQFNNPFILNTSFRINSSEVRTVKFNNDGKEEKISVIQATGGFKIKINDGEWKNVNVKTVKDDGRFTLKINMDGSVFNFSVVITPEIVTIFNQVNLKNHFHSLAVILTRSNSLGWQNRTSNYASEVLVVSRRRRCQQVKLDIAHAGHHR